MNTGGLFLPSPYWAKLKHMETLTMPDPPTRKLRTSVDLDSDTHAKFIRAVERRGSTRGLRAHVLRTLVEVFLLTEQGSYNEANNLLRRI